MEETKTKGPVKENGIGVFHGDLVTSRRNIYTPSVFAKENLLHLQEAGSLLAAKPHKSERSGLSSYLFFIVNSGSGTLCEGGKTYPLSQGSCVFLNCQKPYSHMTSNNLWELKWVHFYGPQMEGIYQKFLERSGSVVFFLKDPEKLKHLDDLLEEIYDISLAESYVRDMKLNEALARLLSAIMEYAWNPDHALLHARKKTDDFSFACDAAEPAFHILDLKDYLDAHYAEPITLDGLSLTFNFNKYYLVRLFRAEYGTTIGSYLTRTRIHAAKKLLRFTDLTLTDVASRVGIHDANYFCRIFKKVEGMTPSQYRKLW